MARSRSHTRRAPRSMPRGTLVVHAEGYGFVRTAEGEYFIPSAKLGGAFDGDVVEIAPLSSAASKAHRSSGRDAMRTGGRPAARVVRVVERAHETLIGRYEVADPFGVVIPEDPRIPYDIFTQRSSAPGIPHGALVRVRISTYPSRNTAATGVVEEVLGEADEPRIGVESIIARHKLETRFSDACLKEADGLRLDVEAALSRGYADLRDRCVFTIDPVDARDFDDALSLERLDGSDDMASAGDAPASPADGTAGRSGKTRAQTGPRALDEGVLRTPSKALRILRAGLPASLGGASSDLGSTPASSAGSSIEMGGPSVPVLSGVGWGGRGGSGGGGSGSISRTCPPTCRGGSAIDLDA